MSYRYIDPAIHKLILSDTRTYKEIAEALGVHKDTVGRIKRQHQWEQMHNGHSNVSHKEIKCQKK